MCQKAKVLNKILVMNLLVHLPVYRICAEAKAKKRDGFRIVSKAEEMSAELEISKSVVSRQHY